MMMFHFIRVRLRPRIILNTSRIVNRLYVNLSVKFYVIIMAIGRF